MIYWGLYEKKNISRTERETREKKKFRGSFILEIERDIYNLNENETEI